MLIVILYGAFLWAAFGGVVAIVAVPVGAVLVAMGFRAFDDRSRVAGRRRYGFRAGRRRYGFKETYRMVRDQAGGADWGSPPAFQSQSTATLVTAIWYYVTGVPESD